MSWSKQRIKLKTPEQIERMAASAEILVAVFRAVGQLVAAGRTTQELANAIETMIRDAGCIPSFKGYNGFPAAACISINEEVVHGIPSRRELREGDIVGIDIGLTKDGWHADSAETFAVGQISPAATRLLQVTRECLELAIAEVKPGRRLSVIGTAIEAHAKRHGYAVVESLVGHGIGRNLHEDPQVPNYRCFSSPDPVMDIGLVIAIEPMVNEGTKRVVTADDRWTVITADKKLSAHFEHTVAVTEDSVQVLTRR